VPNVQWKTADDGQKNCPKHVEFLDKNKFGKLVLLLILLKRNLINFSNKIVPELSFRYFLFRFINLNEVWTAFLKFLSIRYSQFILSFDITQSELLTTSLSKP